MIRIMMIRANILCTNFEITTFVALTFPDTRITVSNVMLENQQMRDLGF